MDLTSKESKFLTILNETRLENGKMFDRYSKEVRKVFEFDDRELTLAIKNLKEKGMLSELNLGGNEVMHFFTEKVTKNMLDKKLQEIRH